MDKILHLDQSLPTPFNFGLGLELHVVKYTGRISICHKNQQFSTIFIVNKILKIMLNIGLDSRLTGY